MADFRAKYPEPSNEGPTCPEYEPYLARVLARQRLARHPVAGHPKDDGVAEANVADTNTPAKAPIPAGTSVRTDTVPAETGVNGPNMPMNLAGDGAEE